MNRGLFATLLQPWIVITTVAVIAAGSIAFAYVYSGRQPSGSYTTPTVGTIVEEVDTTGTVTPATTLDLSFQTGGQIDSVDVSVGQHVGAGQTLASLSSADLAAQLESAKATLAMQQAKLAGLQAGATPQTVAASQTSVSNAQTALAQAQEGVVQASQNAYVQSDDAIHNRVDQFFQNPRSGSPTLVFSLTNSQTQQNIISGRIAMETLLNQWQAYEQSLPSDPSSVNTDDINSTVSAYLTQVGAYLDQVAAGLTEVVPTTQYPLSTIQAYQASVAGARTNISTAVTTLQGAQTAEEAAQSQLASAQSQLTLTQAPATQNDIDAQNAQIASAQASIDLVNAQIGQTAIIAPISGTITVDNANVGETAAPGTPLISMISDSQFQMDTYVSEADLAKVQVGQVAQVELDAYQDQPPLAATVIKIDPAATVDSTGVASYKVTLQFDQNDPRIKAGLTGSVKIIAQTDTNALSVPTSAIITQGTEFFVLRKTPSGDQQVQVQTGISSDAGMTEITSGLSPTDQIETFGTQQ